MLSIQKGTEEAMPMVDQVRARFPMWVEEVMGEVGAVVEVEAEVVKPVMVTTDLKTCEVQC